MKTLIKKNRLLLSIMLLPYLFVFFVGTVRTNYDLIMVGSLSEVGNTIEIDNDNVQKGSFHTVSVMVFRRPTILQRFLGQRSNTMDVQQIATALTHLSSEQLNQRGRIMHTYAVQTSIIVAYNSASYIDETITLDYSLYSYIVHFIGPNITDLQIGDHITYIDGSRIESEPTFVIGQNLTIRRDGNTQTIELSKENIDTFRVFPYWNINYDSDDTNPQLTIRATNVQGSSGGLMQALNNINALLEEDITNGLKIAGTGTINLNEEVGAIGGVRQKVIAAYRSNADVFFIGYAGGNYTEAYETWVYLGRPSRLILKRVDTLVEALDFLYFSRNKGS